jgi:hypothetical protein
MLNDRVDRIDIRTIKRDFIGLTFHSATWIKNLHALHLDEWRFLLVKNLKKKQFSVRGSSQGTQGTRRGSSSGFSQWW